MQKFWIEKRFTDTPDVADECVCIYVPDNCPTCGKKVDIYRMSNDGPKSPTCIGDACDHTGYYPDIWNMRIQSAQVSVKVSISIGGGCSCRKCKEYNNYASPNQSDGSFLCYSCRQSGY